jgi:hypothetical protein
MIDWAFATDEKPSMTSAIKHSASLHLEIIG